MKRVLWLLQTEPSERDLERLRQFLSFQDIELIRDKATTPEEILKTVSNQQGNVVVCDPDSYESMRPVLPKSQVILPVYLEEEPDVISHFYELVSLPQ